MVCREDECRDRRYQEAGNRESIEPAVDEPAKDEFLEQAVADTEPGGEQPEAGRLIHAAFLDDLDQPLRIDLLIEPPEPQRDDPPADEHSADQAEDECARTKAATNARTHVLLRDRPPRDDRRESVEDGLAGEVDRAPGRSRPQPQRGQRAEGRCHHDE